MKKQKNIEQLLSEDTKFMFYSDVDVAIDRRYTRSIKKDQFQELQINGQFDLMDAFILYAINSLGHATKDMILMWLKIHKERFPKKAVPEITNEVLGKRIKQLAQRGVVVISEYVTHKPKSVVLFYTCTLFGYTYYKNTLDMAYIQYDDNLIFHSDVERFKRLTANTITLAIARDKSFSTAMVNIQVLYGKQERLNMSPYGMVKYNDEKETVIYLIEPIYFNVNEKLISEKESIDRISARLNTIEKCCMEYKKNNTTVIPIFCVENRNGLVKLTNIVKKRLHTDLYSHSLYTSENIVYRSEYDLSNCFMTTRFINGEDGETKVNVQVLNDNWKNFR